MGTVSAVYVPLPPKFADHCILDDGTNLYKPENQYQVPWFNVDLGIFVVYVYKKILKFFVMLLFVSLP